MNKDRLIQFIALGVVLLALVGSALMINPVVRTRRDLQLTFAVDNNQGEPPQYALLAAGLGSFRGVAVNALWYRMEMMKRDGQFAEANTLATWISNLQPRFPHVWGFLAWNMAYNISVETFTPQERYDWVNKGVKLLREKGIPFNPNSVRLYRELAWIMFHKMGQFSDDVNWYYKGEFAREWEIALGAAAENLDAQGVIAEFRNVAEMADRYFTVDHPNRAVAAKLVALVESGNAPGFNAPSTKGFERQSVLQLRARVERERDAMPNANESGRAELDALLDEIDSQLSRAQRDAAAVFFEEFPDAAVVAKRFKEEGFSLDADLMRAVGQGMMYLRVRGPEVVMTLPDSVFDPSAKRALPLVFQHQNADHTQAIGLQAVRGFWQMVFFLRAQMLVQEYHMQPLKMLEYMERYGPMDWRNVMSHSMYWSRLGVEQYQDVRDNNKIDVLNTQRGVIHAMQGLVDFGTISFNPILRPGLQIDQLPDPDFIDGYLIAVDETQDAANAEEFGTIRAEAFAAGEENFLQKAVLNSWLYGNQAQAQKYYERLNGEFGEGTQNKRYGSYNLSIQDFVAMMVFDDDLGRPGMTSLINAKLNEAFIQGLANNRGQVFGQNLALTRQVHGMYNNKYSTKTGIQVDDGDSRMRLKPFNDMVFDAFTQFMQNRSLDFFRRVTAYQKAWQEESNGMPLAPKTYSSWIRALEAEAKEKGVDPAIAFPPPVGLDDSVDGVESRQGGETVERQ